MLGTFAGIGPHLTHTIGDVVSVDILQDEHGRDTTLRIAQADSQTRLRIEPLNHINSDGGRPAGGKTEEAS